MTPMMDQTMPLLDVNTPNELEQEILKLEKDTREKSAHWSNHYRKWLQLALYWRGFQLLDWAGDIPQVVDVHDLSEEIFYIQNDFRRAGTQIMALLMSAKTNGGVRPNSDDPRARAASKIGEKAIAYINQEVKDLLLLQKHCLNLCTMGNSFEYNFADMDRRHGVVQRPMVEQFEAQPAQTVALCPGCGPVGSSLVDIPPLECPACGQQTQMEDWPAQMGVRDLGMNEFPLGAVGSRVDSPLLVRPYPSNVTEFENILVWRRECMMPVQSLKYTYRDYKDLIHPGAALDQMQFVNVHYQQILQQAEGASAKRTGWPSYYAQALDDALFVQLWAVPKMYFDKPILAERFPTGLRADIVCGRVVQILPENLLEHWVHYQGMPVNDALFKDPILDDIVGLQDVENDLLGIIVQNTQNASFGKLIYDKQKIEPKMMEVNQPIAIPATPMGEPLSTAFAQIPARGVSRDVFNFYASMRQTIDSISGSESAAFGRPPAGVEAAAALALVQEGAQMRFRVIEVPLYTARLESTKQRLKIAQAVYQDQRTFPERKRGGVNEWEFTQFIGADFADGFTLYPEEQSLRPRTSAQLQVGLKTVVEAGIINPQIPANAHSILEILGLADRFDVSSGYAFKRHQMEEIDMMRSQRQVAPVRYYVDNHMAEMEMITEWAQGDEPKGDPELFQLVMQHYLLHRDAPLVEAMMDQQRQMQQGLMPPMPPAAGMGAPLNPSGAAVGPEGPPSPQPGAPPPGGPRINLKTQPQALREQVMQAVPTKDISRLYQ